LRNKPLIRRIDARAQLPHHVERASRILGNEAQKDFRGDAQRPYRRFRPHRRPARQVSDDTHFTRQVIAAQHSHDEFAFRRLADDFGLTLEDQIRAVRRFALFHEVVAGSELERAAGECQELQLRGVEPTEKRHPAQHFRFLEHIHPSPPCRRSTEYDNDRSVERSPARS